VISGRWTLAARLQSFLRWTAAIVFVAAGANHFRSFNFYCRIVPPAFGHAALLVTISGICEIAGGVGLLIPRLRRPAAWGLIALLIAVSPANLYMALNPARFPDIPPWTLWARLPLQLPMILWIWFAGLAGGE
jgi:uncharacterized membrane protein